jgi:hypothetical protein
MHMACAAFGHGAMHMTMWKDVTDDEWLHVEITRSRCTGGCYFFMGCMTGTSLQVDLA